MKVTVGHSKHRKAVTITVYPSVLQKTPTAGFTASPTISIMEGTETILTPMPRLNQKKVDAIRAECFEAIKTNKLVDFTDFEASALATFAAAAAKKSMARA